jgi:hypothetical protein
MADNDGNVNFPEIEAVMSDQNIQSNVVVTPNQIMSGTLPGNTVIQIGTNNIQIDGKNRRILMNDGANNRVLIGDDGN